MIDIVYENCGNHSLDLKHLYLDYTLSPPPPPPGFIKFSAL